jgi:acyl carrier protein
MNQPNDSKPQSLSPEQCPPAPSNQGGPEAILLSLVSVVTRMIQDWDRDIVAPLGKSTLLVADLGCQSLDIVILAAEMNRQLNRTDIPYERLFLPQGEPISDLSLGELADFLWDQVRTPK